MKQLVKSPTFLIGLAIVLFWIFCALFSDAIVPHDPINDSLEQAHRPHPRRPTGSALDEQGRDMFSRVIAGSREHPQGRAARDRDRHRPRLAARPRHGLLPRLDRQRHRAHHRCGARHPADRLRDPHPDGALGQSEGITSRRSARDRDRPGLHAARSRARCAPPRWPNATSTTCRRPSCAASARRTSCSPRSSRTSCRTIIVEATVRLGYAVFTAATLAFLELRGAAADARLGPRHRRAVPERRASPGGRASSRRSRSPRSSWPST